MTPEGLKTMCSSREFQIWAAVPGKDRLPTVESLTGGTTSRLDPAERSVRRPGTSAAEVNDPRYRGASQWRTVYSPKSTWLVSTRLDTFDVSSLCILAVSSLSNNTARHARLDALDTSNVSSRVETWRDEPSGIWANVRTAILNWIRCSCC